MLVSHCGPDDGTIRIKSLVDLDFVSSVVMNLSVRVAVEVWFPGFLTHHAEV